MFANHGHPRVQEKLVQNLFCGIQLPLFEPSNGVIAKLLDVCCDYLTSERFNLALQETRPQWKRIVCSKFEEFVCHGMYLTICLLLSRLYPSELFTEVLATTGLDAVSVALMYSGLIKDNRPASTSNCEPSFQQICEAVGALRSSENITELWLKACPDILLWDPESEEAEKARSRLRHKGKRTSSLEHNSAAVESHQTMPPSLPGATSTMSDLDCFFDFTAFSSPSPTVWRTNLSPERMRSSLDMVSTPRLSNHPSNSASILPNPGNRILDNPRYEEMDQS